MIGKSYQSRLDQAMKKPLQWIQDLWFINYVDIGVNK